MVSFVGCRAEWFWKSCEVNFGLLKFVLVPHYLGFGRFTRS